MKQIELTNSKGFALVDDEDYEWLSRYKWFLHGGGYATRNREYQDGKPQGHTFMHREILGLGKGDKRQGDHANGNRLDNRRQNLRVSTHQENCYNKQKTKGRSKYKGVSWHGKRWQVHIVRDLVRHSLGLFDDEIEAAIAYDHEARKLFGEFAKLNFPDIDRPAQGRIELTPKGKSKYFGVHQDKRTGKWIANVTIQRKTVYLGSFEIEEDAARAHDSAAKEHRGENTRTNFH